MSEDIIDSHQHFWRLATGQYTWLRPENAALYRDFGPDDLAPQLASAGVSGTVLVQAADSETELSTLADYAEASGFVKGIVAPLDLGQPQAENRVDRMYEAVPLIVGFRPRFSDLVDTCGGLNETGLSGLARMSEKALALDCLVGGEALAAVPALAKTFPDLTLIVDHCGEPKIEGPDPSRSWTQAIAAIARAPNAYCKVSGLFTLVPPDTARCAVAAHVDVLVSEFGMERLMWGSDWPVLTQAGTYGAWLAFCRDHFAAYPAAIQKHLFSDTARRAYRLDEVKK